MSSKNSKPTVDSTSFTNEDKEINNMYNIDKDKYREEEEPESKEGALSAWFRPDTGNGNGYGHQSLVPLRQHMYSLPIYTRRLQVLTYALAEISSAATLIADYTRSLLNLSRRLVICWESVLHAALMWQHVEKQTHRVVLQCVKRTWYKLHNGHFTHTSQKYNKNKINNHGLSHKHHFHHHRHLSANKKFNVIHKNTPMKHSIYTSSSSSPSSLAHSLLSLPKLTHSFAHHAKQSNTTNKSAHKLNSKISHSSEEEEAEEEEEEEKEEEREYYEELEEEKQKDKFGILLHKSEKKKRNANSKLWCKVQVAVLMNKNVHKLVRHALRYYYKHENIVASQLEKLRSTIVAAILQQFLTVHVKESYHDTLLHSWLPRPQQNELINVSHALIHSHVCNIISKLQNEEYKEHELYQSDEEHEEEEEEKELEKHEEEAEKEERQYNASNKDDKQSNVRNTHLNKVSKKEKLPKAKEHRELNNTSSLENLQKEEEKHHLNEHSLEHVESNQSNSFVLPAVIRKRHRSAAQSANNSKNSESDNNIDNSDIASLYPSEEISFSTMSTSELHKSKNSFNDISKKNKCNNAKSNPLKSGKESKSSVKKGEQSTSVPNQEECCESEESFSPKEEHASSYQYANWSNSLSLAFFMHAAASANSTLCALSVISRCVYNASHVISSDDESPQAWRRCRDWQNEHSHNNNNNTKHNSKNRKEGDVNTPTATTTMTRKWKEYIHTADYEENNNKYNKDTNNNQKLFSTNNAEEDDRLYLREEPEELPWNEYVEKQQNAECKPNQEKTNGNDKVDDDDVDDEGFYYIIVAARAVNACNHSATCFGNRKFIFIECDDVEALLRRTEEQQEHYEETTSSPSNITQSMERKTNIWDVQNKEYSSEQYTNQKHYNEQNYSHLSKYNANTSLEEERLIGQEHLMDDKTRKHHEVQRSLPYSDTLPLIVKPNLMQYRTFTPVDSNALQRNNTLTAVATNSDMSTKEYNCNNDKNANETWLRSLLITQHRLLPAPPPSKKGEETKCKTTLYNAEEDEEMENVNMIKSNSNNSKTSANTYKSSNNEHFNEPCNREYNLHSCEECEENEDTNKDDYSESSTDEPKFIVMNALYCSLVTNTTRQRWSGNAESEDAEPLAIDDSSFHVTDEMNMHNSKNDNYANNENYRTKNTFKGIHNTDFRNHLYDHVNNESALVLSQRVPSTSPVTLYESNHIGVMNARYYDPNSNNTNAFSNFAHTILMPPSSGQENTNYGSNNNYYRSDTSEKNEKNEVKTKQQVSKLHIDDTSSVTSSEGDFAFAAELFARLQFWCVRGQDRSKFKACNILPHSKHVNKHNACKDEENEQIHKTKKEQEEDQQQEEEEYNKIHKKLHGKEEEKEEEEKEEEEEEESEWRKEFVQRPVKLLSSSVGNMTFHFSRYGDTVNNMHDTSGTTGMEGNMNESAVFGANIRGQELLYEALSCTTHVVICEVRESRAHKDYHDALHVLSLPHESSTHHNNISKNNSIDEHTHTGNTEMYEYNYTKTHSSTKKDTKINEMNKEYNNNSNDYDEDRFVELATLSDDEADPYWYDRQSKLDVHAVAEWAQGEMSVEMEEPKKKWKKKNDKEQQQSEQEEYEQNIYYSQHSCRKPLPNRERRQRRNEMLKNEFRLARSTRLDALLVDEVNDKPIATIVLEATYVPYTTNDAENTQNSANYGETLNSPINISTEQAVQNTIYSVVSFSQYIAPLWDHMHHEKAIMVDLDRTLVDNAILVSSSSSSSSSLSLSPSQSLLLSSSSSLNLLSKKKVVNKTNESSRLPSQVQHSIPLSVLHLENDDDDNINLCWNEQTGAKFSEIAELFPSLLQQRIRAKNSHNNNTNIDAINKALCTPHSERNAWQQYAYRCRVSYHVCLSAHTDDTVADLSQPLIHEVIYIRPDVRIWLYHMSIRWNIPLILVTKSTRLRAQAILSQLLDPCQLLFTNELRQLVTSCQVEHAKKMSLESDKSVNHSHVTASTESTNSNDGNNSEKCQRQQIASKSAYHVLRIFDCVDKTRNYTNWSEEHYHHHNNNRKKEIEEKEELCLYKSCQARSIAIVDDAVQVWESHDWPRAIAIAPYTLSRVDPAHYLSVNGGYITSLVLSALYSKKELTCPFAEEPTCVLHNAQNIRAMNYLYKTNTQKNNNSNRYDKVHCICSCVAPCCTAAIEQRRRRTRDETRHVDRSIKQFHMYYTSPVIESSSNLPRLPPIPITPQITQEPESMKRRDTRKAIMNEYNKANAAKTDKNKLIRTSKTFDTISVNNNSTTPFSTSSTLSFTNSSRSLTPKEWEEEEYWSSLSSSSEEEEEEEEEEEGLWEITPVSVISSKSNSPRPSELVEQHLADATQGRVQEQQQQQHFIPLRHNQRHKHTRNAHMTPPTPNEFASQSQTNLFVKNKKSNNNKKNITTSIGNNKMIATINTSGVHDKCISNSTEQKYNTLQNKLKLEPPNQEHHEQQQKQQGEEEEEVEDVVNAEEAVVDEGADEDVNVFAQANTNDTFDWQFNKKNKPSSIWADDTVEDVVPL